MYIITLASRTTDIIWLLTQVQHTQSQRSKFIGSQRVWSDTLSHALQNPPGS